MGVRVCFPPARSVVVRITGICLSQKKSRRALKQCLAFLMFIVDTVVTRYSGPLPSRVFTGASIEGSALSTDPCAVSTLGLPDACLTGASFASFQRLETRWHKRFFSKK